MAYYTMPNTFTTATTMEPTEYNDNFNSTKQALNSYLRDLNADDVNASAASFAGPVSIGVSDFFKVLYYSHTITAGDVAAGYATKTISSIDVTKIIGGNVVGQIAGGYRDIGGTQLVRIVGTHTAEVILSDTGYGRTLTLFVAGKELTFAIIVKQ